MWSELWNNKQNTNVGVWWGEGEGVMKGVDFAQLKPKANICQEKKR